MKNLRGLALKLQDKKYQELTNKEASILANTPGAPTLGTLGPSALLAWGASSGARSAIEDGVNHADHFVASICLSVRDMLASGAMPLVLTSPEVSAMIDVLVSVSILSEQQRSSLYVLGSVPGPSDAQLYYGGPVDETTVAEARNL